MRRESPRKIKILEWILWLEKTKDTMRKNTRQTAKSISKSVRLSKTAYQKVRYPVPLPLRLSVILRFRPLKWVSPLTFWKFLSPNVSWAFSGITRPRGLSSLLNPCHLIWKMPFARPWSMIVFPVPLPGRSLKGLVLAKWM